MSAGMNFENWQKQGLPMYLGRLLAQARATDFSYHSEAKWI
jgi:hypothetical protein